MARTPQSPLETYLRDINQVPLLTADEEKQLARRIADGDPEARDHMIRANLRLVVNIARGYVKRGLSLMDLIEEGNLGLLRAVQTFDPDRETRFSTYGSYWIKQAIKRALINTGRSIRIPAYMVELVSSWKETEARLADKFGHPPTPEETAAELDMPPRKLAIVKKAVHAFGATPQSEDAGSGWTLGEMLTDHSQKTPDELLFDEDELNTMNRLLGQIDEREALVLRLRFGLKDQEPQTLKQIGEVLGLTRERVRQIERDALKKLHEALTQDD